MTIGFGSIVFLAGLLVAQLIPAPFVVWFVGATLAALLTLDTRSRARQFVLPQPIHTAVFCCSVVALFLFGGLRAQLAFENAARYENPLMRVPENETVQLMGQVVEPPQSSASRCMIVLRPLSVRFDDPVGGETVIDDIRNREKLLLMTGTAGEPVQYGDVLAVTGVLSAIPENSRASYLRYLRREGITFRVNRATIMKTGDFRGYHPLAWIYRLRELLAERIYSLYPEPESGLIAGIIVGDESRIAPETEDAFRRTGTAHVVAISGTNFTVLIWLIAAVLDRISKRWWVRLLLLPFIIGYTILTGASAAIVRAGILSGLTLISELFGHEKEGESSLALSAALMAAVRPGILFDVGFQLSVMATLGILLFNRPLLSLCRRGLVRIGLHDDFKTGGGPLLSVVLDLLNELIITSVSAQVFTTLICAAVFHQISWVTLPCNAAIALLQSPIMIGGFLSVLLSLVAMPVGAALAWSVTPAATLTIRIVEWFASVPGASSYICLSPLSCWLMCLAIVVLWKMRARFRTVRLATFVEIGILALGSVTLLIWGAGARRLDASLRVSVVQEGEGTLVEVTAPTRERALVGIRFGENQAESLLKRRGGFGGILPEAGLRLVWLIGVDHATQSRLMTLPGGPEPVLLVNGKRKEASAADADSFAAESGTDGISLEKIENGTDRDGTPERYDGFCLGGVCVRTVATAIRSAALTIEYGRLALLIPGGIPVERLTETVGAETIDGMTAILLGNRDEWSAWVAREAERERNAPYRVLPTLVGLKLYPNFTIRSDGEQILYTDFK